MRLSLSTLRTLFVNLEDDAFEDAVETRVLVKKVLDNPKMLNNYINGLEEDNELCKDDEWMQDHYAKYVFQIKELKEYLQEKFK